MKYTQSSEGPERDKLIVKAASESRSGAVHLLLAQLALEAFDHGAVLAIAKRQEKQRSPELTAMLGEAALALGDLDALNVNGEDPQSTTLRVVRAYEQGDAAAVTDLLSQGGEAPRLLWFQRRLLGDAPELSADEKTELEKGQLLGGRLLVVDLALDGGQLAYARVQLERDPDAATHPLKARRWARLLRYEGNTMAAHQALKGALQTVPAQIEAALISAERPALAKAAVLTFDPSAMKEGLFLKAYLLAQAGSRTAALSLLSQTKPPEDAEPLSIRVGAALAYGALKVPNGSKLIRSLIASHPQHPDVRHAAKDAQIALPPARTD